VTDDLENNNLGAGEFFDAPSTGSNRSELASYLGRVNYTFKDRYIFSFAGRYDGSSKFGANNKWGFFPSAAVAWRVSDEPFLADRSFLSDLKLRASYGRTGNQALSEYQSLQRIVPVKVPFGNALSVGFVPANLANPDLRWETTSEINVGFDLGLWDHRVRLTTDLYRKDTEDLLAVVRLPPSSGYSSSIQNVGGIRNTGVEVALGADLVRTAHVLWSLDANIAANRNVVTETAGGVDVLASSVFQLIGSANIIRKGEPLAAFYGFREDGLDVNGQVRYQDVNGDGIINDADRVILGDPYPDFTYGLSSTLRYGRFEVSAFLQGVAGMQVLNINRFYYASSFNRGLNQVREVLDYWTPENPTARYPKISSTTTFRLADRWVEDASYLRLKNVRVAFNVPESWLRFTHASDASVYAAATNLFTRTHYSWYDPEVSSFGGDNTRFGVDHNTFPQARTYTFGVRFGI
jgi:TonB-linked SusC/RagA family outer membrane protein